MFYKNARIFASDFQFHTGSFQVEDGRFGAVLFGDVPEDAVDLQGATVIPGLVDAHVLPGNDLKKTAALLAQKGITAFAPLLPGAEEAQAYMDSSDDACSRLVGIRLEEEAKDLEALEALKALLAMAKLPGNAPFLGKASGICTIALSDAEGSYENARDGFAAGATYLTSLYDHLPLVGDGQPGVIPAAVENPNVKAELICDRSRCHPALVRLAFAMFGPHRMVLASGSDSQGVDLFQGLVNAVSFGIPECDALRAATYNAACAIGAGKEIGMIAPGRRADFIICRSDFSGRRVFIAGEEI